MLRPLVNQPQITLFMATIGLTFFIEGLAQMLWGANVRGLELGIQDEPIAVALRHDRHQRLASSTSSPRAIAAVLVAVARRCSSAARGSAARCARSPTTTRRRSPSAFRCSRSGRIVWAVAGFVALVAGLLWGARNGVQFALTFVALKALPVLILGGFESVPGAIVGGLIIGAAEKLAEVYLGPVRRRRHRGLVPVRAGAAVPAGAARRPVRRKDHPPHLTGATFRSVDSALHVDRKAD